MDLQNMARRTKHGLYPCLKTTNNLVCGPACDRTTDIILAALKEAFTGGLEKAEHSLRTRANAAEDYSQLANVREVIQGCVKAVARIKEVP